MTASAGHALIDQRWIVCGIWRRKERLRSFWSRRLDRLARRYAYQVVLVEEFIRDGCEVVFVHQSLGASPEEQMLLQMQGLCGV